jgi:hypothetical protein
MASLLFPLRGGEVVIMKIFGNSRGIPREIAVGVIKAGMHFGNRICFEAFESYLDL